MKNLLSKLALLSTLTIGSGCATIFTGTKDKVYIDSSPPEARVVINGETRGVTPYMAELPRRKDHEVRIEKEGFHTSYHNIERELNPVIIANIFCPIIGFVVDFASGAAFNFDRSHVYGELTPKIKTP